MARAMKDSGIEWIGKIPEEWEVRKVKNYYVLQTGFTPDTKREDYYDDVNGYDWVNISDIQDGGIITETKRKISKNYIELFQPSIIPAGSLMYSFKLSVGQVAFAGRNLYSNEAIASFLPQKDVNLHFLRYSACLIIENAETNIYNAKILNRDRINNARIVFPPKEEQQKIANFLDSKCASIDAVIEKTKASIEEYRMLKQAIITQAVTKGIRPNRKMKDSGIEWIGEIPEEWKICKVRHIGLLQNGISKGAEFFGEGYPFVSYGDVYKNMKLPEIPSGLVQTTDVERNLYSVKKGDVFFTRTSETIEEVGFSSVCFNDIENATFAGFLIRLRPYDEMLDLNYSAYYFRSSHHRFYLVKEMNLVTRASLGQPLLKGMIVLVPGKDEQIEISDYLDIKCGKIDSLISNREDEIQKLELYKKSLIYEYVTGKKEVSA